MFGHSQINPLVMAPFQSTLAYIHTAYTICRWEWIPYSVIPTLGVLEYQICLRMMLFLFRVYALNKRNLTLALRQLRQPALQALSSPWVSGSQGSIPIHLSVQNGSRNVIFCVEMAFGINVIKKQSIR